MAGAAGIAQHISNETGTAALKARAWIGTSGWNYRHWRGILYPNDMAQSRWLAHYARNFDTVEVNNSFYKIPGASTVEEWSATAPQRFRFAMKTWRGITHFKKLKDPKEYIEKFLVPSSELGNRQRAPLLVQLPPNMGKNVDRLESFLDVLKSAASRRWKVAVEFRNPEWLCSEVYALLDRMCAAICLHDMPANAPVTDPNDASFIYMRRHGSDEGKYSGSYSPRQIEKDADRIRGWLGEGRTVYVYFNNDLEGHAVHNARDLEQAVSS